MHLFQAFILSAVQGLTELFPFSSLGFQVILPKVLGWHIDQSGAQFLPFVVSLHLGTATGLIIFFWKDWVRFVGALWRSLGQRLEHVRTDPSQKTIWLLIAATIPAGLVGFLFQHPIAHLFADPMLAAVMMLVNAAIMVVGERLIHYRREDMPSMRFPQAIGIGVAQILALVPGLSRSGVTIVAGLGSGLSYETAARFSFLLATPIILAAALLEMHKLHGGAHGLLHQSVLGFVVAGVVAYFSVRYLVRYFETRRLLPLAAVSAAAGVIFTVLLAISR